MFRKKRQDSVDEEQTKPEPISFEPTPTTSSAAQDKTMKKPAPAPRKPPANAVDHTEAFMARMAALLRDEATADIWFVVGPQQVKIPAHRSIVGTASEYFKELLLPKTDRPGHANSTWTLKQADPEAFGLMLEYLYTGKVRRLGDLTNKMNLMVMGDVFGLEDLAKTVAEIIQDEVSPSNVCKLYMHCVTHEDARLKSFFETFIEQHAGAVLASDGITRLSAPVLLKLVQDDALQAQELQVFRGVAKWLQASRETRLEDAKAIGEHIRLPLIHTSELLGEVEASGFISSERLLKVVKIHHSQGPNPKGEGKEFTPRGSGRVHKV